MYMFMFVTEIYSVKLGGGSKKTLQIERMYMIIVFYHILVYVNTYYVQFLQ